MRQSQFKKNSISLLVLSALCATASAQVVIKGMVDQSYEKLVTKTNPGPFSGSASVNKASSTLANYNWLSFSGNEDMGEGLKATYEMSLRYVGPDTENRAPQNYLSHVGLEGGFGKVKLGRQWRPLFTAVAAIDPTQLSATPGFAGAGKSGTGLSGLAPDPNNNTLTYNLPSLTPGLFIQAQKGFADATQGENFGGYVIFTDGQKFYATYAINSAKMLKGNFFAASATGTNGTNSTISGATLIGMNGLNHVLYSSANGGETRESSTLAGSYNFGVVKVVGGVVTEKVNGTKAKLDMDVIGLNVPLGAQANLGYLHTKANHTRAAGSTFNISGDKVLLSYNLSKRTTTYFAWGKQRLDGKTTTGNEFSTAMSALGLRHSF